MRTGTVDLLAYNVARRYMASLSDNPEKWRGQTQDFHKKPRFEKTRAFKDFTLHWRTLPQMRGFEGDYYWMVATSGDGPEAIVVATLYYGPWNGEDTSRLEGAIEVDPRYRRQGLASAMYDWGEQLSGLKFAPASSHTHDAEAFWQARRLTRR